MKWELWNDISSVFHPLWRGRWRAEDLASCGYYSPLKHQLMLICHTRPKNVKNEGGQGVYEASSRALTSHGAHIYFFCTVASSHGGKCRHPHVHTHTEILKIQQFPDLRRWKLCKLSCSDLQKASKLLGLITTWAQICFLFLQRAELRPFAQPPKHWR